MWINYNIYLFPVEPGVFSSFLGSAQYVVIVQYPIEEEKDSVGSSSLHVKHYPFLLVSYRRLVLYRIYKRPITKFLVNPSVAIDFNIKIINCRHKKLVQFFIR